MEAPEHHIGHARRLAGEVKAMYGYLVEESRAIGLDFMEGIATVVVRQISEYDRPLIEDVLGPGEGWLRAQRCLATGRAYSRWTRAGRLYGKRSRRTRKPLGVSDDDPEDWVPASYDREMEGLGNGPLEVLKGEAARGLDARR